jgi:hypothetical protein
MFLRFALYFRYMKLAKPVLSSFAAVIVFPLILLPSILYADLENGAAPDVVVGQANLNTLAARVDQSSVRPFSLGTQGDQLFVADFSAHRIMVWNSIPKTNNAPADFVLGQAGFTTAAAATSRSGLRNPSEVFADGQRLFVTDFGNQRVLIWNRIPSSAALPDVVLGQNTFDTSNSGTSASALSGPAGGASDGRRLYIGDRSNNRVLIWNTIPTANNQPADIVLGQANFTDSSSGTSRTKFSLINGVHSDGQKLFVCDFNNNRVLIWNHIPTETNTPADVVLGQKDFGSAISAAGAGGMANPTDVFSDGQRLYVVEQSNHRVLVWNSIPTHNGQHADIVLGQPNFTERNLGLGPRMNFPSGIHSDGKRLYVADLTNQRALIFTLNSSAVTNLGPQFEQGKAVLGKVFEDPNHNGRQDRNEKGLEGIKVASDTGIYAITDEDGKYHFPFIQLGQRVLKIDESTLPDGAEVTTESPRKIIVTKGILTKVSFGIKLPEGHTISEISKQDIRAPLLKTSLSQDAAILEPRLSVSAQFETETLSGKLQDTILFTIECNYFLFIEKAELRLYDKNHKLFETRELSQPLPYRYEIPLRDLSALTAGMRDGEEAPVFYQLSLFDQKGREDRTGLGALTLPAKEKTI